MPNPEEESEGEGGGAAHQRLGRGWGRASARRQDAHGGLLAVVWWGRVTSTRVCYANTSLSVQG